MTNNDGAPKKTINQLLTGIIVFGLGFLLVLPWRIFLESLKKDNPQLSTSLLVQFVPVFFALFVYGIIKSRQKK